MGLHCSATIAAQILEESRIIPWTFIITGPFDIEDVRHPVHEGGREVMSGSGIVWLLGSRCVV